MIVRFCDATKKYPEATAAAVERVSLDVPRGQFCVVLGASGAGKSTLLRMVNGLVEPNEGFVEFEGIRVDRRTRRQVQPRIGMVHQQFNLVPRLNVLKNVLAGALPQVAPWRALLGLFPHTLRRRACELLAEVGLQEKHLYRRASYLSGGEQQRVAIARAFILEPDVVLADEPVASLDPETSRVILDLLRTASQMHGATVLCSLHQVDLAVEFADRIVAMQQGRVVFDGPPAKFDDAAQQAVYAAPSASAAKPPKPSSPTSSTSTPVEPS